MTKKKGNTDDHICIQFDLDRDDNPRLFDELFRFGKGKRAARLKTLAQDGLSIHLMAFQGPVGRGYAARVVEEESATSHSSTNPMFESPWAED